MLLCLSLLVLVKSTDYLVEAAARIAKYFGVSEFIIGLTIVSLGTTLPELSTSILAAFAGITDLAVGNALGSAIANIGFILGLGAAVAVITVEREKLARDCLVMLGAVVLFAFFAHDGSISFAEGCVCLLVAPAHLALKLGGRYRGEELLYWPRAHLFKQYLRIYHGLGKMASLQTYKGVFPEISKGIHRGFFYSGLTKDLTLFFGLATIIGLSAKLLIDSAIEIALFLNIGEGVIGATIIAVGTSLPELSVAVSSIRKGFNNIMLGNIIGANIFDLTLVIGVTAVITPITIVQSTVSVLLPFTLLMSCLLFIFIKTRVGIRRSTGLILLAVYSLFIYLLASKGIMQ